MPNFLQNKRLHFHLHDSSTYDAVIFDMDGTLVDSMGVWETVDRKFFSRHQLTPPEEYYEFIRTKDLTTCALYTKEMFNLQQSKEEIIQEWLDLSKEEYAHHVELMPGVAEFLQFLQKENKKLILLTACIPELVELVLNRFGWRDLFAKVYMTADNSVSKSEPSLYKNIASEMGLEPERCVFFDDLHEAVAAAGKAGWQTGYMLHTEPDIVLQKVGLSEEKTVLVRDFRQFIPDPLLYLEGETRRDYIDLAAVMPKDGRLAVAFSGGVDSSLLIYVATKALGYDAVQAILGLSPFTPKREIKAARDFCQMYGLPLGEASFSDEEMRPLYGNPVDRCYHCKKMLFSHFLSFAKEAGFPYLAEGSNLDDLGDYRPGMKAISELQVLSPLRQANFTKARIRRLSKALGLPTWDTPSLACLATRLPYDHEITLETLARIDQAEEFLLAQGLRQVRVRAHDDIARLELGADEINYFYSEENRLLVVEKLKNLGFAYVTLDLGGYKTGSMNKNVSTAN